MKDLFETPKKIPLNVLEVLNKFNESENDYQSCQRLVCELEAIGYTCEYGLDAEPFNLIKL